MKKNKKFALLAVTGTVATSLAVGGATYALFTTSATNSNNKFMAGSLEISSARDDIPMSGPMFYTESPTSSTGVGGLSTGVWAPGDQNTRGLFITNNGSLDGKLTQLTATPQSLNGNTFTNTTTADDTAFANNATVMVWNIEKFDPSNDTYRFVDPDLTPADINSIMSTLDATYKLYVKLHNAKWDGTETAKKLDTTASFWTLDFSNAQFLNDINQLKTSIDSTDDYRVTAVGTYKLSDLINGVTPGISLNIPSKSTLLLGYTVALDSSAGNALQGIKPYFSFGSTWAQSRNN